MAVLEGGVINYGSGWGGCNQLWQCWSGGVINYGSVGGGCNQLWHCWRGV